tara:strand:+ start:279 stop:677 length:399 start_codon:yes stop_codon:yes gene_type:complete
MERKPLATEADLLSMDSGEKYGRYLYDLETVYADEIKQLEEITGKSWSVWQTGGMCCVLGQNAEYLTDDRALSCCPEGNLDLDRSNEPMPWYLGWDQEDENGSFAIVSGENDMFGSFADVAKRLQKYVNEAK